MMPKYPKGVKPAPMPKVEGNYGKPRSEQTQPKRIGPKNGPKSRQNPSLNKPTPKKYKPAKRSKGY
jgi:hypothetical protein